MPKYMDAQDSDEFLLSGGEVLVPVLEAAPSGKWSELNLPTRSVDGVEYNVRRYRPRVEGDFTLIEQWTSLTTGDAHWRTVSGDNVITIFGWDNSSRIFDPNDTDAAHPTSIFTWLPSETYDDKGNAMAYKYAREDSRGVNTAKSNERHRDATSRSSNLYPKRILYGNPTPLQAGELVKDETPPGWLFEIVFDYGDHDQEKPSSIENGAWSVREDPFSSYKSGFEIRTYRLCQRVLMFHHFKDEAIGADCLVRSTDLAYRDEGNASPEAQMNRAMAAFIASVEHAGYMQQDDGYVRQSFPKVEFEYSKVNIDPTVKYLDPESLNNLPAGVDGSSYRWVDLNSEGLSGVLSEEAGQWFYKPNNGSATLGPAEMVSPNPSMASLLANGSQQLMDLAGDGTLDFVQFTPHPAGFFERESDESWADFVMLRSLPNIDWQDPNMRFIDLTGDGRPDILITENEQFVWYASMGKEGFEPAKINHRPSYGRTGPRFVFSDSTGSTFLADMSGDGLADLVHIESGEVYYLPNLGYGRFGRKVTMDNAPLFEDYQYYFDPRRIRLADIDGSGTADIIYLSKDGVKLFFNLAGNEWALGTVVLPLSTHQQSSVETIDLLGNGTTCLVWSSSLPSDSGQQMRYVDLMGGVKPHLLVSMKNNMGSETRVEYAPSTKFYLQDKIAGRAWVSKLPFCMQVIERVITIDYISKSTFTSRYSYHHGYYDGIEREFQGFGMVEQWDTESIEALRSIESAPSDNWMEAPNIPPVLTRSWFHTGLYLDAEQLSSVFATEYYKESALTEQELQQLKLDDTVFPTRIRIEDQWQKYDLDTSEAREACRALRGHLLRQEIFSPAKGLDEKIGEPYAIKELNYSIEIKQPRDSWRSYPVFLVSDREQVTFHYDAQLIKVNGQMVLDPRITHSLTLEVNEYGQTTSSVTVGYGRRESNAAAARIGTMLTDDDVAKQMKSNMICTETTFTNAVIDSSGANFRLPARCETRKYEVLALVPRNDIFTFDELHNVLATLPDIPPENWDTDPTASSRRLLEHSLAFYRRDDLTDSLPFGRQGALGLRQDDYNLVFTSNLLKTVFVDGNKVSAGDIETYMHEGAFVQLTGYDGWWMPSGRTFFSANPQDGPAQELAEAQDHFFLTRRYRSPFDSDSSPNLTFPFDKYSLLLEETIGNTGNRVTVGVRGDDAAQTIQRLGHDYRTLEPVLIMEQNRNQSAVMLDALGMVIATAAMGKPLPATPEGDLLDGFTATLTEAEVEGFFNKPLDNLPALLGKASSRMIYDLSAYERTAHLPHPEPVVVATLVREKHVSDLQQGEQAKIQLSFSYTDGFGREVQHKTRAESGPAPQRDANGRILVENGEPVMSQNSVDPRWCGTGWTVYNNKGDAVKTYHPFFSNTHHYDFDVRIGFSPTFLYDPLQRVVATLNPNGSWTKTVIGPWSSAAWDENDTVLITDLANDADVGKYFADLDNIASLKTWYSRRITGDMGVAQQNAAQMAEKHATTPMLTYFDSLGRTLLTVAHNRDSTGDSFHTLRSTVDVEGNERELYDQAINRSNRLADRLVSRSNFDLNGKAIYRENIEAGARWMLHDIAGNSLYSWDITGTVIHNEYDELRRPVKAWLKQNSSSPFVLIEQTIYGDADPRRTNTDLPPETNNLKGMVVMSRDQAGEAEFPSYDFMANCLVTQRRFADDYKNVLDWQTSVSLGDTFSSSTSFDAINRVVSVSMPGGHTITNEFNEASLLERVLVDVPGVGTQAVLAGAEYDAKGQRVAVDHGNGVGVQYTYNAQTSILEQVITRRNASKFPNDCPQPPLADWPGCQIQSLSYTCDAAGNITNITDNAQQTIFFDNTRVEPSASYEYDALYRLIKADGREHLGQTGSASPFNINQAPLQDPRNGNAMGKYTETYKYDRAGNILEINHDTGNGQQAWTRVLQYSEPSLLDPSNFYSNRLSTSSSASGATLEEYGYDQHGNTSKMPHLSVMGWDYRDLLRECARQIVNTGSPETTWYVYNAGGQRVRKITEWAAAEGAEAKKKSERYYLGSYEQYHEYNTTGELSSSRESIQLADSHQRLALIEMSEDANGDSPQTLFRYQYGNHLNSTSLELDGSGGLISYEEYYPYGTSSYSASASQIPKRYRFSSKERDDESGFYYFGGRYYMPWASRWISCDPGGLSDGANLYRFARCNPISMVDPNGREGSSWLTKTVGVLQLVGGGLEVAAGVGGVIAGGPAGWIVGGAAIAHGLDTLGSGYRTLRDDKVSSTYTQQAATATAKAMGASPEAAERIGIGVDFVAGVVPSMGVGVVKSTIKTAATQGATKALAQNAPTAVAHATASTIAPKAVAATATESLTHAAPEIASHAAPEAATHTAPSAAPQVAVQAAEKAAPQIAENAAAQTAEHAAPQAAEHAAPEAASQVSSAVRTPAVQATRQAATAMTENQLRRLVFKTAANAIEKQRNVLRQVIQQKNVAYLERLGIRNPRTINALLQGPSNRRYAMIFGNVLERMVARSFRSNPLLSRYIRYISNLRGFAPAGRRPDFLIRIGNLELFADLTTKAARAAHFAREAASKPLIWVYVR